MSMIGFPLLLIPLAIYNIIVFLMPGTPLADGLFPITLMSGVIWQVTLSDILLALGILMLMFEVMKGARPGGKYLTDHLLSLIVLCGAAAEFLLLPQFGTSTFALLTMLALVDFLSGISLRQRRTRPATTAVIAREDDGPAHRPEPVTEPAVTPRPDPKQDFKQDPKIESRVEPRVDTPHVPTAAPVAESILSDAPAPVTPTTSAPPAATPIGPVQPNASPQVSSPGLQPANDQEPPPR